MKKSTQKARSFLASLLSFMLSLSIVMSLILSLFAFVTYTPYYTKAVVRQCDYAKEIHKELKEEFISYGHASNIEASFFETLFTEVLTEDTVKQDTETMIQNFFSGAKEVVNTEKLEQTIFERLKAYAIEQGFHLDSILESNLQNIAKELGAFYRNYLSILSATYFKAASSALKQFRKYLIYGTWICFAFLIASVVLIVLLFKKDSNRLRFLIYATSAAALMLAIAPITIYALGMVDKINIASMALYQFATGMAKGMLLLTAGLAIVPILVTIGLSIGYRRAVQIESKN